MRVRVRTYARAHTNIYVRTQARTYVRYTRTYVRTYTHKCTLCRKCCAVPTCIRTYVCIYMRAMILCLRLGSIDASQLCPSCASICVRLWCASGFRCLTKPTPNDYGRDHQMDNPMCQDRVVHHCSVFLNGPGFHVSPQLHMCPQATKRVV